MDWPANPKDGMSKGRVLRRGTNGWTCMPDVRKASARPDVRRRDHDEVAHGDARWKSLTSFAGGLSYMLLGEARQGQGAAPAKDPSQVKEWFYVGPHIMVAPPVFSQGALQGINQDISITSPIYRCSAPASVATPIWVIPVAKGGNRIKEEPVKQGLATGSGMRKWS